MSRRSKIAWLLLPVVAGASGQQPDRSLERLDRLPRLGTSQSTTRPVFNQLVMFSLPDGFASVASGKTGHRYTEQAVPANETRERWTQRIAVSGDEAEAFNPRTWPQQLVDDYVARARQQCAGGFSTLPLTGVSVGSSETAAAVVGCGADATMRMVFKGGMDLYALEWTVRGPARSAVRLDRADWDARLRSLAPVRLCTIVPDEAPPYPSCGRRK